jgi:hypothetical protein
MKNEIILYRPNEAAEHIEVRLENETVWLNQEQISLLFQHDQSVISRHINNVFKEEELRRQQRMVNNELKTMSVDDSDLLDDLNRLREAERNSDPEK